MYRRRNSSNEHQKRFVYYTACCGKIIAPEQPKTRTVRFVSGADYTYEGETEIVLSAQPTGLASLRDLTFPNVTMTNPLRRHITTKGDTYWMYQGDQKYSKTELLGMSIQEDVTLMPALEENLAEYTVTFNQSAHSTITPNPKIITLTEEKPGQGVTYSSLDIPEPVMVEGWKAQGWKDDSQFKPVNISDEEIRRSSGVKKHMSYTVNEIELPKHSYKVQFQNGTNVTIESGETTTTITEDVYNQGISLKQVVFPEVTSQEGYQFTNKWNITIGEQPIEEGLTKEIIQQKTGIKANVTIVPVVEKISTLKVTFAQTASMSYASGDTEYNLPVDEAGEAALSGLTFPTVKPEEGYQFKNDYSVTGGLTESHITEENIKKQKIRQDITITPVITELPKPKSFTVTFTPGEIGEAKFGEDATTSQSVTEAEAGSGAKLSTIQIPTVTTGETFKFADSWTMVGETSKTSKTIKKSEFSSTTITENITLTPVVTTTEEHDEL